MRRGNLHDWGNNKVTWKRIRDLLTRRRNNVTLRRGGDVPQRRYWVFHLGLTGDVIDTTSRLCTTETFWLRTTETSFGVSFETCLRHRGDALMGRCCYVLLRRHHDVPIRCHENAPLRPLGDVPPRCRWVFHLRRTCLAKTCREASSSCCWVR